MKETNQKTATEILKDVSRVVFDLDDVPSVDEAHEILDGNGVDMADSHKWILSKVSGLRARQKLVKAKAKRLRLLEILEDCKTSVTEKGGVVRESVLAKLNSLGDISPERAQAFCHRFESASEEDLADIEAEILMLDFYSNEFDDDDKET